MTAGSPPNQAELEALRAEVARLRTRQSLHEAVDAQLEISVREHHNLAVTMDTILPSLAEFLGARSVVVRTYDETLRLRNFHWSRDNGAPPEIDLDAIFGLADAEGRHLGEAQGRTVLGQILDVAGQSFGVAAVGLDCRLEESEAGGLMDLLDTFCEVLDNYLASIAQARRKHHIISAVADALKTPVLGDGIDSGLDVLQRTIGFHHLAMVFQHGRGGRAASWGYRLINDSQVVFDSNHHVGDRDTFFTDWSGPLLAGRLEKLEALVGEAHWSEHGMESGVVHTEMIGRLLVGRHGRDFDTFERDILSCFADFVRQRLVDYNREWRQLSCCFTEETTKTLLRSEGYIDRSLSPRERDVAILFTDLTGFTRISEQVLKTPSLIGKLVDLWSERVVEIIWETGGVFDKMVGDCVIGLWGPPFFDLEPAEACTRAARAAAAIRDFTATLGSLPAMPELAGHDGPLGLASGLNFCPLFVGRFGPNEAYTGFSSGMNNTARLQGVAERGEILCLDSFVAAISPGTRFGPEHSAQVKNVSEPLRYRELLELVRS